MIAADYSQAGVLLRTAGSAHTWVTHSTGIGKSEQLRGKLDKLGPVFSKLPNLYQAGQTKSDFA